MRCLSKLVVVVVLSVCNRPLERRLRKGFSNKTNKRVEKIKETDAEGAEGENE